MKRKLLVGFATLLSFSATAQDFDLTFDGDGWREDTIGDGNMSGQMYYDALIHTGNKLVVSGLYDINNFLQDISVVRYNTNGSLDNTFGTNGKVYLTLDATGIHHSCIAQNPSGEIYVAGSQANANGPFYICKLTQNGSIDNTFGTNGVLKDSALAIGANGTEHANDITIQPDGKILVAGYYHQTQPNTEYAAWVIRYNANGTRDNNFGTNGMAKFIGGDNFFNKLLIQPDGKILAGGSSGLIQQQQQDWFIVRLKTDGTPDSTFGGLQVGTVTIGMQYRETVKDMGLQSDGSIIIGGPCGNGNPNFRIVKLTASGLNDVNFGTASTTTTNWGYTNIELQTFTDHYFAGMAVLPDDKIALAGTVSNFKFAAVKFLANGDPDIAFGTNAIVDSQFAGGYGVGMQGAIFDNGTGRLYAVGGTYNGNDAIASSAVAAINVAAPNSVKEIAGKKELKMYPNPVTSVLHLQNANGDITIYDISGRTLLQTNGQQVNVSLLTNGMYFLKCTTKDGTVYVGQFVKE